jgi:hypothetical protein
VVSTRIYDFTDANSPSYGKRKLVAIKNWYSASALHLKGACKWFLSHEKLDKQLMSD